MKKKATALISVLVILASFLTSYFVAYGKTQPLFLDVKMTCVIDGSEDMAWFTYTPDESGVFSFLSYVTPATEAYLFIKERDPETGAKKYIQLEYARNDPNYIENGHNLRQFCLTYHLEKGVTYYFAAGWYLNSRTDGTMTVMLRCDMYDSTIDYIEASCDRSLIELNNGSWSIDSNGQSYFYYNLKPIEDAVTITIHYIDGEVATYTGVETIEGMRVLYLQNQSTQHWYPEDDESYTGNVLTVKVLDKTAQINIRISPVVSYVTSFKVVDVLGNPIKNAAIRTNGQNLVTRTDDNGVFTIEIITGLNRYSISTANSIDRTLSIFGSQNILPNYFLTPIELLTCDYVDDDFINAKDFAMMKKTMTDEELVSQRELFIRSINRHDYPDYIV